MLRPNWNHVTSLSPTRALTASARRARPSPVIGVAKTFSIESSSDRCSICGGGAKKFFSPLPKRAELC